VAAAAAVAVALATTALPVTPPNTA
jgi:hypothetical protein